jgi:hypothetical protein
MTKLDAMERLDEAIIDLLGCGLDTSEIHELVWETAKNWNDDRDEAAR